MVARTSERAAASRRQLAARTPRSARARERRGACGACKPQGCARASKPATRPLPTHTEREVCTGGQAGLAAGARTAGGLAGAAAAAFSLGGCGGPRGASSSSLESPNRSASTASAMAVAARQARSCRAARRCVHDARKRGGWRARARQHGARKVAKGFEGPAGRCAREGGVMSTTPTRGTSTSCKCRYCANATQRNTQEGWQIRCFGNPTPTSLINC